MVVALRQLRVGAVAAVLNSTPWSTVAVVVVIAVNVAFAVVERYAVIVVVAVAVAVVFVVAVVVDRAVRALVIEDVRNAAKPERTWGALSAGKVTALLHATRSARTQSR